ncbi:hypothetical protein KR222_010676 [Zaprionus bogoriensis]|nr:hypothetical protein KR222_010676 [Zaprionus bogoriensis]
MQCVCCRCGAGADNSGGTLCLPVAGTEYTYHCHCFCCARAPRMKCIYCNIWRDLELQEAHGTCFNDDLHVFAYSEPWPPFPASSPKQPVRAMVMTVSSSPQMTDTTSMETSMLMLSQGQVVVEEEEQLQQQQEFQPVVEAQLQQQQQQFEPAEDEDALELLEEEEEQDEYEKPQQGSFVPETADVKPQLVRSTSKWVSIGEIRQWTSCIRCGMVKIRSSGWLRHVQQCAQDPTFQKRKFFIYLHTKAWCNMLVMDSFWEKHTHPQSGSCAVCRESRRKNLPMPYMPQPPARRNGSVLARQHTSRQIRRRRRRREEAIGRSLQEMSSTVGHMQIVGSSSMAPAAHNQSKDCAYGQ